jgi:hypothetical protein
MGELKRPGYTAALAAAMRVDSHFRASAGSKPDNGSSSLANPPDPETIAAIIDAAFWASLRRNEGYSPEISLALVHPSEVEMALLLAEPQPLSPEALTRLAPAVKRPGIHLGVSSDAGQLWLWGTTRTIPMHSFVLEVVAPGLLVVKHRRAEESAKFVNVAVLEGDRMKILEQHTANLAGWPGFLSPLFRPGLTDPSSPSSSVLIELTVSMRAHGHGGALLIVPSGSESWRTSIAHPIAYAVAPPYSRLAALAKERPDEARHREWQDEMHRAVEGIAGLTAVDGATILNDRYELLAFGAKIIRRERCPQAERALLMEPLEGAVPVVVDPGQIGGTRHMSAVQFVHDQRNAMALVASQDGRFTVFDWSDTDSVVLAWRVETLLL